MLCHGEAADCSNANADLTEIEEDMKSYEMDNTLCRQTFGFKVKRSTQRRDEIVHRGKQKRVQDFYKIYRIQNK